MMYLKCFILFLIAYLISSIPSGLVLTKLFLHKDVRKIGSGNIGATNVLRTGSKWLAAFTLLLDACKPYFSLLAVRFMMEKLFGGFLMFGVSIANWIYPIDEYLTIAVCAVAILGHCYPIYLKFKGGKGVATVFGSLFLFSARPEFLNITWPVLPMLAFSTWLIVAVLFKKSSLAALTSGIFLPVYVYFFNNLGSSMKLNLTFFYIGVVLFVVYRHKSNIKRLIAGTESNIKLSKDESKKTETESKKVPAKKTTVKKVAKKTVKKSVSKTTKKVSKK